MTFGLCTLSFVHCILEVRISAVTQSAGRPSTKFAGSCPSLVTEGQSEIHTFLFDVVITYVCRREVYPDEENPRMKLERLSETFGLIDSDGNDAPPPALEEVYNRVRLAASVAYLEAGEDILRTRLSALVEGGASELFVAHDPYSFHRPVQTWERVKLPPQYECGASGRGRR